MSGAGKEENGIDLGFGASGDTKNAVEIVANPIAYRVIFPKASQRCCKMRGDRAWSDLCCSIILLVISFSELHSENRDG